jgi:hypothetical protein
MQQNNNTTRKNRVYAPIIMGISIILIVLVIYPMYINYTDTKVVISSLEKTKVEKLKKIDEITAMQRIFTESGSSDIKSKVQKYNHPYNTSNILEAVMVNKYTKSTDLSPSSVNIGTVSVDKGKKLPSGLSLANVSIVVSAESPDQIIEYITYLTTESSFAFTLDNISLPLDTASLAQDSKSLSLALSLGVYYYE